MRDSATQRSKSAKEKYFKIARTTPSTGANHNENDSRDFKAEVSQFRKEGKVDHSKSFKFIQEQRVVLREFDNQIPNTRYYPFVATKRALEIDNQFDKILIQNKKIYVIGTAYGFDVSKDRIMLGDRSLYNILTCDKLLFSKIMQKVSQTGYFHKEKGIRVTCKRYGIRKSAFQ